MTILVGNDEGHVVCVNGRVARIISALSLLDNDSILAEPELDEAEIKNLAYSKANNILQKNLKEAGLEDLYIADREKISAEDKVKIEMLENKIREEIGDVLKKEYNNFVPTKSLTEIIAQAQEAI
jgi:hypothetical protein